MTPSELKYEVENNTDSCFFSRRSMKFFGDTMKNYGCITTIIEKQDGELVNVWELRRKRAVKHGLKSSAYFDKQTFKRVHPNKEN